MNEWMICTMSTQLHARWGVSKLRVHFLTFRYLSDAAINHLSAHQSIACFVLKFGTPDLRLLPFPVSSFWNTLRLMLNVVNVAYTIERIYYYYLLTTCCRFKCRWIDAFVIFASTDQMHWCAHVAMYRMYQSIVKWKSRLSTSAIMVHIVSVWI